MTTSSTATDTAPEQAPMPSPAGDTATLRQVLPLNQLVLIGIAGTPENRIALLRDRKGAILRVQTGDKTPRGKVAAIGETTVHLQKSGKTETLDLPAD